jgi:hypothetical protein
MVRKGDDENFKGLKSDKKLFSICVCRVVCECCWLAYHEKAT